MIPGIVAAQIAGIGGGLAWVPAGALLHLDFINGLYWDGAEKVAADVIDHPDWLTVDGLALRFDNETSQGTGIAHMIGDALTALVTANWTAVVEFEVLSDPGFEHVFSIQSAAPDWDDALWAAASSGSEIGYFEENTGGSDRTINNSAVVGTGVHRFAMTRTDAKLRVSTDGATVDQDPGEASSTGFAAITATFGGYDGDWLQNEINIRSLTLYAPVDDAELSTLSA